MDMAGGTTTLASPGPACSIEIRVPAPSVAVNLTLAGCSLVMLAFCLAVHPPGAMHSGGPLQVATLVLAAPLLVPAAYWHQNGNAVKRDAALMLPWTTVLATLVAQMAATAAPFVFPLS